MVLAIKLLEQAASSKQPRYYCNKKSHKALQKMNGTFHVSS